MSTRIQRWGRGRRKCANQLSAGPVAAPGEDSRFDGAQNGCVGRKHRFRQGAFLAIFDLCESKRGGGVAKDGFEAACPNMTARSPYAQIQDF